MLENILKYNLNILSSDENSVTILENNTQEEIYILHVVETNQLPSFGDNFTLYVINEKEFYYCNCGKFMRIESTKKEEIVEEDIEEQPLETQNKKAKK